VPEQPGPLPVAASRARTPRFYYGWWIVAASAVVQMFQNALIMQAFGGYIVELEREFHWSKTLLSGASSMQQLQNGATGPFVGWLLDRVGPRLAIRIGVLLMGVGCVMFSRIHDAVGFYVAFFVIAVGANMAGYLTTTFTIVHWFDRRRSTALSLSSVGNSLGGIAFVAVAVLLETVGWRSTALISGIVLVVLGIPLAQVFYHRPEDIGLHIDGDTPHEDVTPEEVAQLSAAPATDYTLGEALRHPSFWWVSLGHASALFVVGAVNVHLIAYLTQTRSFSLNAASAVVLLVTVMFGVGTVAGGFIGDKGNRQRLSVVCMWMHMTGMLLLAYATGWLMVIAFGLIHGFAWGWRGPQMAALRADYFGRTAFGKIMGISNIVVVMGNVGGPLIAGYMYDHTGDYRIGFDIIAGIALVGSLFFYLAKRPAPPQRTLAGE
jgi:MFS family permease